MCVRSAEEEAASFWGYIWDELHPTPSYPTTDVVWGQTERQRVYAAPSRCTSGLRTALCLSVCFWGV